MRLDGGYCGGRGHHQIARGASISSGCWPSALYCRGSIFNGLIHLANASLLVKKRLMWGMWWWIAGSVSCIGLNFLLVPAWGILGAAVTQAISFAVIAGGVAIGARRTFPLALNARRLVVLLGGVLVAGIAMSMPWWTTPIKSLLMKLPAALVVAFIVMRLGVRGVRA
jgi:O-antigen/teichoic acid export membrane protein